MIIEENVLSGGLGSRIMQTLHNLDIHHLNIRSIGINDQFTPHGPQTTLRKAYALDSAGIYQAWLQMLERNRQPDMIDETLYNPEDVCQ
jgi:deoxyxylulose-5-phosphate synthase